MLILNFNPFPELSTPRLLLKRITAADTPELFAIRSNPDTMRFIPRPIARTHEDIGTVLNMVNSGIDSNESINWGLYPKDSNRLIGMIGYVRINKTNARAEVGYVLNPDYQKKGFMKEALEEVLRFGFSTLNFNCIEAIIDPANEPSQRIIQHVKFLKEGLLRDFTYHNNMYSDAFIFSKLKREHQ